MHMSHMLFGFYSRLTQDAKLPSPGTGKTSCRRVATRGTSIAEPATESEQ